MVRGALLQRILRAKCAVRRFIRRAEKAVVRGYNFVMDFSFYLERGHHVRTALQLARDTIHP